MGVIKAWMEDHFYDFEEPEVQTALENFFAEMNATKENSANNLIALFNRLKKKNLVCCVGGGACCWWLFIREKGYCC